MKAKSFVINGKGFCVCQWRDELFFFSPDDYIRDASLREIRDILVKEAAGDRDRGVIEDVLSFFSRRRDRYILDDS